MGVAGFIVGVVVGLTGMGGGALMTPILVLLFGVSPATAVSSDLVASLVMRPVGVAVHLRRRTVHAGLVRWLCVGSVPTAFLGALVLRAFGNSTTASLDVEYGLGAALLLATAGLLAKALMDLRRPHPEVSPREITVRPLPTLLIGALGGFVVGMTSVGSGSLIIVALLFLYPRLTARSLVGTDLVQAIPLTASAALGHLLFGHVAFGLTAALIIGSVPGVYLGARLSAVAPSVWIRRALVYVLLATALKLVGVPTVGVAIAVGAAIALTFPAILLARRLLPAAGAADRDQRPAPAPRQVTAGYADPG